MPNKNINIKSRFLFGKLSCRSKKGASCIPKKSSFSQSSKLHSRNQTFSQSSKSRSKNQSSSQETFLMWFDSSLPAQVKENQAVTEVQKTVGISGHF